MVFLVMLLPGPPARAGDGGFAYDQRLGNQVPLAVQVRDELGHTISLGQVLGHRPAILVLGAFHCSNLCGRVRGDLMDALMRLNGCRGYGLIFLSVDASETPADARAALQSDIARFGRPQETADWHYLTGSEPAIAAVAVAVGFRWRLVSSPKRFLHPAGLVFLTRDGGVSSYLSGLNYEPDDIGAGIVRAANDLSARILPILLVGFGADRRTGRCVIRILPIVSLKQRLGGAVHSG
nr:SCO family protein [uncultured Rhodopila sp.]